MKVVDFLKQVLSEVRLEVAEYDDFYNGYVTTEVFTGMPEKILGVNSLTPIQESFLALELTQVELYQFKNNDFTCICISQRIGEGEKEEVGREKLFYQMTCKPLFGGDIKLIADKDLTGNKDFIKKFGLKDVVDPKPFTSLSEIEIGSGDFYFDNKTVVPIIKGKFSLEDVSRH